MFTFAFITLTPVVAFDLFQDNQTLTKVILILDIVTNASNKKQWILKFIILKSTKKLQ